MRVIRPGYDPAQMAIGVVHFGPGAFFRAHQADYFDQLLAREPGWGICAVSLKSTGVRDALLPQDGLYTLVEKGPQTQVRVIGALREVLVGPEQHAAVMARVADPGLKLITMTVTEKGYCLDAAGALDLNHTDIRHDLANPAVPRSLVGWLVQALRVRRAVGPVPIVSCDNLADNGVRLKNAVLTMVRHIAPDLVEWIAAAISFPRTMVDSITPATDDALRAEVRAALVMEDAWPIQREPFTQFVVDDTIGAVDESLRNVGVVITSDVRAYEQAKLRLLNGAHSTLAYMGALRGFETVAEAMNDPDLAGHITALMDDDILPTLKAPPGFDVRRYAADLRMRFRNPAIRHKLLQIAWDGSQKLPVRIVPTIIDALAVGRSTERLAVSLAAWMQFVRRQATANIAIVDPLADELAALGRSCVGDDGDVPIFFRLQAVFPPSLTSNDNFVSQLTNAYRALALTLQH
ncbi:MAG: mannitol dehydrogenase family protein [Rhodospirillaceae bacterium]|nr:mannitol dehydrogenase family protein [Rhodospirillaceae bacterium]